MLIAPFPLIDGPAEPAFLALSDRPHKAGALGLGPIHRAFGNLLWQGRMEGPLIIAVVDDDLSVRKALERLLRASGFEAVTFASGHEFFFFLETRHADCLVLDLHMPGMNGLEVQRRLAQCGFRVPVIVVTGHDEPRTRSECLSAGAVAYFSKPLDDKALIDAIESAVAHRQGSATPHYN